MEELLERRLGESGESNDLDQGRQVEGKTRRGL